MDKKRKIDRTRLQSKGDILKNKPLTQYIVTIMLNPNKKEITRSEIHKLGQSKYGNKWPKGSDTIYHYLNSMTDDDILELIKPKKKGMAYKWKVKKSPYSFETLVLDEDIDMLKLRGNECISNMKKGSPLYTDIIADEAMTIYGFPKNCSKDDKKELNRITKKMKDAMEELHGLTTWISFTRFLDEVTKLYSKSDSILDRQLALIYAFYALVDMGMPARFFKEKSNNELIEVIPDPSLAEILQKYYYKSKSKSEIIKMMKQHRFPQKYSINLAKLKINYWVSTTVYFQSVLLRGGLAGGRYDPLFNPKSKTMKLTELEKYQTISKAMGLLNFNRKATTHKRVMSDDELLKELIENNRHLCG